MSTDLKLCPFCGKSEPLQLLHHSECDWLPQDEDDPSDGFYVICAVTAGGCGTSSGWGEYPESAAALWNRRTK